MKTKKIITSLVLVLVLGLSMTATAFASSFISEATVKEIAYSDAGVSEAETQIDTLVFYRDGKDSYSYKFVFHTTSHKYVYTINAYSGAITGVYGNPIHSNNNNNSSNSSNEVVFYYDEVLSIALADAGVSYTSIEAQEVQLKEKNGYYYYSVEVETVSGLTYKYEINAATGEITSSKTSGKSSGATDTSYIGTDEAMSIAQPSSGISTSDIIKQEVELTTSKKVYVYEVEFKTADGTKAEYTINASTGAIISSKVK